MKPGEQLEVNSELFSLTSAFTLSLWAKVLDDGFGVLARNGQFSLGTTKTIQSVDMRSPTMAREKQARLPSGRWVHYVVSYDGDTVRMFLDGQLVSETSHNGYLAWEMVRIINFTLTDTQKMIGKQTPCTMISNLNQRSDSELVLWSMSAGDLGLSPLITGTDTHFTRYPPLLDFFVENNQTISISGLLQVTSMFQMPR